MLILSETIVNLLAWNITHKTAEKVIAPIAKTIYLSDLTRFYIPCSRMAVCALENQVRRAGQRYAHIYPCNYP